MVDNNKRGRVCKNLRVLQCDLSRCASVLILLATIWGGFLVEDCLGYTITGSQSFDADSELPTANLISPTKAHHRTTFSPDLRSVERSSRFVGGASDSRHGQGYKNPHQTTRTSRNQKEGYLVPSKQESTSPSSSYTLRRTSVTPELQSRAFSYRNSEYFRPSSKSQDEEARSYQDSSSESQHVKRNPSPYEATRSTTTSRTSAIRFEEGQQQYFGTTPVSKTAPATTDYSAMGPYSTTLFPPQFQGVSSAGYFHASETNNHNPYAGNGFFPGYSANSRGVPVSTPTQLSFHKNVTTYGKYSYVSSTESIVFDPSKPPALTKNTYKLPQIGHGNELDISSVNFLGGSQDGASRVGSSLARKPLIVPDSIRKLDCASQGYCDNLDIEYPAELLKGILPQSINPETFKKVFGDAIDADVSSKFAPQSDTGGVSIHSRNGLERLEFALCQSREITIYPKAAKNKDDKWMFIVNHDEYVQGVKVEQCTNEGDMCQSPLGLELGSFGYESICRQKHILRKLVALNPDEKTLLVLDTFKMPSCCVCFLRSTSGVFADRRVTPIGTLPQEDVSSPQPDGGNGAIEEQHDDERSSCSDDPNGDCVPSTKSSSRSTSTTTTSSTTLTTASTQAPVNTTSAIDNPPITFSE